MRSVFINVMCPATSSGAGTVTFTFTKANVLSPVSFSIDIDIASSDNELTIANKLWTGLTEGLSANAALYNGTPSFLTDTYQPFTFQVIRTAHMISVWSEASYQLEMENGSDSLIELCNVPIYGTLAEIISYASISGVRLLDVNSVPLTPHQIILAAKASASTIVQMMNGFNIIPTTYLQIESGEWQRGICCRYAPVISRSPIMARGPYTANYSNFLSVSTVQRVDFDPYTGMMWFLDYSNSLGIREATEFGNSIIWSYVAGYEYAAEALMQALTKVIGLARVPAEVAEFQDSSFRMKFVNPETAYATVAAQLSQFQV